VFGQGFFSGVVSCHHLFEDVTNSIWQPFGDTIKGYALLNKKSHFKHNSIWIWAVQVRKYTRNMVLAEKMRMNVLLMDSFKKPKAAVFWCRLCFLRAFLFISLVLQYYFTCWDKFMTCSVLPLKTDNGFKCQNCINGYVSSCIIECTSFLCHFFVNGQHIIQSECVCLF